MNRPRVLVLGVTPITRDPRIMRHVAALVDVADVLTVGQGPAPDGVIAHLALPDGIGHLPTSPAGLAALATRQHRMAYARMPVVPAMRARLALAGPFDVILANDAVTLPAAVDAAAGRPVVADLHEYAPREMEEDWRWRLAMQPLMTWICRTCLPRVTAVTTVAPGIAAEYRVQFGVTAHVVTNAGTDRDAGPHPTPARVRLVHSGNANPNRRLEVMIEAAADLPNVSLDLFLVEAPRAAHYLQRLTDLAGSTANVRVLPPVPMAGLVDRVAEYDVGVYSLAPTNFNNLHALPNKFFDFIQARLGIVVGPSPEMAALVREHSLGAVADDFGAPALRRILAGLDAATVDGWKSSVDAAAATLGAAAQAATLRRVVLDAAGSR